MADKIDFKIVDKLAHAYGWTVEYIENLGIDEVTGLINAINEREEIENRMLSYIFLLGFSGKTIDGAISIGGDSEGSQMSEEAAQKKQDEKNIMKLFNSHIVDELGVVKGEKK